MTCAHELPFDLYRLGPRLARELQAAAGGVLSSSPNGPQITPTPYPRSPGSLAPLPAGVPALVGIIGLSEHGKDEVAAHAQRTFAHVARVAFSDSILPEVNEWLVPRGHHVDHTCKNRPEIRRLLQAWGSARRAENPDHWTEKLAGMIAGEHADGARLVFLTGLRLPTDPDTGTVSWRDVEFVRENGGEVWVVRRPGHVLAAHEHPNEKALKDIPDRMFDRVILNGTEGSLDGLRQDTIAALTRGRS